jgi:hypothetical protein
MAKVSVWIKVACVWFLLWLSFLASILLGVTFSFKLGWGSAWERRVCAFLANFSVCLIYKRAVKAEQLLRVRTPKGVQGENLHAFLWSEEVWWPPGTACHCALSSSHKGHTGFTFCLFIFCSPCPDCSPARLLVSCRAQLSLLRGALPSVLAAVGG